MIQSWLIDQLIAQGVTHFCIAPGSRSTPLVEALLQNKAAKIHVHFDERGLAFYALGIAKGTTKPVALIVTSGTAVGNLLPAVMEAHHSCTPLIILTADRPLELSDCGANQATDQVKIFSSFVRFQTDISYAIESTVKSIAANSVFFASSNPPGPVHLNCRFAEPFLKAPTEPAKAIELHYPQISGSYQTNHSKGLILIGKLPRHEDITPILKLAKKLKWPVLADILSNARSTPTKEQINYHDWLEKPAAEFVLHFGERLTSKRLLEYLKKIKPEYVHVSPYPHLQDPERLLTARVQSDIEPFCKSFVATSDPQWILKWASNPPAFKETGVFTEVHAMHHIANLLPPDMGVFLGNGMPIRDGDHFFFPKEKTSFFGNRGLSGIDGNIATIAGLAETRPMLGIIGDQTALYDLNSLPLLKKSKFPVTLLISNNFGGGVFQHLPIASSEHFETFWAAAHDFRFEKAAAMFDLPYEPFEQIFQSKTSTIIELITCRKANHLYQTTF